MIRKILHIILVGIVFVQLDVNVLLSQNTGARYLRIGELWHEEETIPKGGWEKSFIWPGDHWRVYATG